MVVTQGLWLPGGYHPGYHSRMVYNSLISHRYSVRTGHRAAAGGNLDYRPGYHPGHALTI